MTKYRRPALAASISAALLIVFVYSTITWLKDSETVKATADTCQVESTELAPAREDLAFGPDVRSEIANFDTLTKEEQIEKVISHQAETWCRYPAIALANAMHRGIKAWPATNEDWLRELDILTEDKSKHLDLVAQMIDWEDKNVIKYDIVYNHNKYLSDWFDRSSGKPVLVRGNGHAVEAGWVIQRTLKDGNVIEERLVCMYQLAGPISPEGPTPVPSTTVPGSTTSTTSPPTTSVPGGKDASERPPQDPVVSCPPGQYADRSTGSCTSGGGTPPPTYDNDGGDSGPGAPGPGVSVPPTDPKPNPTVPTNTGPGDGYLPDPGV